MLLKTTFPPPFVDSVTSQLSRAVAIAVRGSDPVTVIAGAGRRGSSMSNAAFLSAAAVFLAGHSSPRPA
jgi:hypothetical protein